MDELKALQKDIYQERVKNAKAPIEILQELKEYDGDYLEF